MGKTSKKSEIDRIDGAVRWLMTSVPRPPRVGLILGSGMGGLDLGLADTCEIPYSRIPDFPLPTVEGHGGKLIYGFVCHQQRPGIRLARLGRGSRKQSAGYRGIDEDAGTAVAVLCGRWHFYEGYSLEQVVFPVRTLARWGAKILIVTNAAGGVNPSFMPGDLMLIRDHINLLGASPLRGPNIDALGPRFPDMSEAYDRELLGLARRCARTLGLNVREGVYLATMGPNYETPTEVRMMRLLGADAIGMSTVPEVIAARHAGMRVLGISMISNLAAGLKKGILTHEEVIATGKRTGKTLGKLLRAILWTIACHRGEGRNDHRT